MLIDTHAHLDFPDFAEELPAVVQRARAAGVQRIITIGTGIASSQRAIALAERYEEIYAAVGIHPCNVADEADDAVAQLTPFLSHPKVVAIGECGLDYYHRPERSPEATPAEYAEQVANWQIRQKLFFQQQLELAAKHQLNVVIHQRHSWDDVWAVLTPWNGKLRAVFHCFGETKEQAQLLLNYGHLVSFTGIITFKNGSSIRHVAQSLPAGSFMVETDCPYLAPIPYRGKRCEPAYVVQTAETIAQLRGVSLEKLATETKEQAQLLLNYGHLVSFTGIITFKNGSSIRHVAQSLPAGSFMVETDCPYLAPIPHRGKRCEPAYVVQTAETIAQLRGVSLEKLATETTNTAKAFFRF